MLFPCWLFNHASGFSAATKIAVYNSRGHIGEQSPIQYYRSHLPSEVIQQLNAAKGRLRTILYGKIFEKVDKLLDSSCDLKEESLFGYVKALRATKVWPLDTVWGKMEVHIILNYLAQFEYTPTECLDNGCDCRHHDFNWSIKKTVDKVRWYFDGLCLDCMDKSKAKTTDHDSDYWFHNNLDKDIWDRGCRGKHREPTWYFSFMGRRDDRDNFFRANNIPLGAPAVVDDDDA
ncbi:MAG: hypothetical protein LQ350_003255 [Teloschistes chrysophthalmus]|nr:MAG: hypothetical protein LQ350_003255 [Niorma chrysophthalma]